MGTTLVKCIEDHFQMTLKEKAVCAVKAEKNFQPYVFRFTLISGRARNEKGMGIKMNKG